MTYVMGVVKWFLLLNKMVKLEMFMKVSLRMEIYTDRVCSPGLKDGAIPDNSLRV